ncbi:MAG: diaminopimelate decarboxylase [Bacteroidaceae bacterium]|nr:diaminopimelate decarboxylase [Bacteroidaceae bacterium]
MYCSNQRTDRFKAMRTPYYRYDLGLLDRTLAKIRECTEGHPNWHVHYAIKANANPTLLERIRKAGLGIDCVSGGEISKALENGFPATSIVFAGVGKADWEIDLALEKGIACFNVESQAELEVIIERCQALGRTAHIALRVNPNVDAHTHAGITTGLSENKFGIEIPMLEPIIRRAIECDCLVFEGLHFHIGSQILDMEPFMTLADRVNELQDNLEGKGIKLHSINVGGGLGVDYDNPEQNDMPCLESYFKVFEDRLKLRPGQQLHFELGRAVVAQCGRLITRVLYVKQGTVKKFAIVDAGFTELIRPAFYGAHHKIVNLSSDGPLEKYDVVGPICESSDTFEKDALLPEIRRGDLIAILTAGAYGETMASCYNCRPLPKSCFD